MAGLALGAIAYALILSVVNYGSKGPKYWFDAKFLNRPLGGPSGVTPGSVPPAPNVGQANGNPNAKTSPSNPQYPWQYWYGPLGPGFGTPGTQGVGGVGQPP